MPTPVHAEVRSVWGSDDFLGGNPFCVRERQPEGVRGVLELPDKCAEPRAV